MVKYVRGDRLALSTRWKKSIPWIWGALIFGLAVYLAVRERADVIRALPILAQANYGVLGITAVVEVFFYALQAIAARALYAMYGRNTRVFPLTALFFQATMLNEVLPTSGASGTAGFVFWGDRLGYGLRDSMAVNIWLSVLSYVALLPVIGVCIRAVYLLPATPRGFIVHALLLAIVFTVATVALLAIAYWFGHEEADETRAPKDAASASTGFAETAKRIRDTALSYTRSELGKEWSKVFTHGLRLLWASTLLAGIYAVRVLMLTLCFAALHHPVSVMVLVYVYCLTLLFSVVSLSPTTLGVVEIALTTTLHWFGVPVPVAVAGTILYRLASFWFPIPMGLLAQWYLAKKVHRQDKEWTSHARI